MPITDGTETIPPKLAEERRPAPWTRRELAGAGVLALLHLLSRLPGLSDWLPLLNDESIELHRALLIAADPADLWLPHVELKPPLFYWLLAGAVQLGPPLLAARLVSALAGFGTLLLTLEIGRRVQGARAALASGALLVAAPLAVTYDRTAFMEPLLGLLALAMLGVALRPVRNTAGGWRQGLALGLWLSLAFAVKQTALLLAPFLLVLPLLRSVERRATLLRSAVALGLLALTVVALGTLADVEPIWAPDQATLLSYHREYALPMSELLGLPVSTWVGNGRDLAVALVENLTWPFALLLLAGVAALAWRPRRPWLEVGLFLALPVAAWLIRSSGLRGIYLLSFLLPPACLLAGCVLARLRPRLALPVALLVFVPALLRDARLLTHPMETLRPMRWGVLAKPELSEGAVGETASWLRSVALRGPIRVLQDLSFGMPGDALAVELADEPRVDFLHAWWLYRDDVPLLPDAPIELHRSNHHRTHPRETWPVERLRDRPLLWITNSIRAPAERVRARDPLLRLVQRFDAGDGSTLDVWQVWPRSLEGAVVGPSPEEPGTGPPSPASVVQP